MLLLWLWLRRRLLLYLIQSEIIHWFLCPHSLARSLTIYVCHIHLTNTIPIFTSISLVNSMPYQLINCALTFTFTFTFHCIRRFFPSAFSISLLLYYIILYSLSLVRFFVAIRLFFCFCFFSSSFCHCHCCCYWFYSLSLFLFFLCAFILIQSMVLYYYYI